MTRTSIHEYVAAKRPRYLAASRREKRRILDEVVAVTGYHRKAAEMLDWIFQLRGKCFRPRARGRAQSEGS